MTFSSIFIGTSVGAVVCMFWTKKLETPDAKKEKKRKKERKKLLMR
jgi:hypothetical protein